MFTQSSHHLHHFLRLQPLDCCLHHISNTGFVDSNKALVVHEGEETHDKLTIHTIGDTAVAGNGFAKIFDFERAFEAGGEEATKGCDEGGEGCENQDVELHRGDMHGRGDVEGEGERYVGKKRGNRIGLVNEDRVGRARKTGENVRAEVL